MAFWYRCLSTTRAVPSENDELTLGALEGPELESEHDERAGLL
jgi:hypothetical protein